MPDLDIDTVTTTNLKGSVTNTQIDSETLDSPQDNDENYQYYDRAPEQLGIYKNMPEFKATLDASAIYSVGLGFTADRNTTATLENVRGDGKENILQIWWNLYISKKIYGDAFAEIIRNDDKKLINLKVLDNYEVAIVRDKKGQIIRYEWISRSDRKNGKLRGRKILPSNMFHITNDKIGNEQHGVSVCDSVKFIIEFKNEVLRDERMIRHRELAMGILEIDSNDETKRDKLLRQYAYAIKNGEVLALPKDVAELKDNPVKPQDRIQLLQYIDSYFYRTIRVPKVIAESGDTSEASSKVGFLTFQPIYTREQAIFELDVKTQLGLKIKFKRPPELGGIMQESEQKNTGQLGIQPNEVQANIRRSE